MQPSSDWIKAARSGITLVVAIAYGTKITNFTNITKLPWMLLSPIYSTKITNFTKFTNFTNITLVAAVAYGTKNYYF